MNKTRKDTTLLSVIGDRRSPITRITTAVALTAMFWGSVRVGWAAAPPPTLAPASAAPPPGAASRRVRPIAVEDVGGRVGADALWKLFDGDASTGIAGEGAVRVKMTFADPIAVTTVGGFDPRSGKLVLRGADGTTGGEAVDPAAGGGARWARVDARKPTAARTFVVEWAPTGAGATLPELEVWGRFGAGASSQWGRAVADALYGALPDGAESFAAPAETHIISVATVPEQRRFSVTLPHDPRGIERAFLTYELDQLPHFTAATRKINGGPAVGGFGVSKGAKGGLQVEEIAPVALRKGANTVEFLPVGDKDPVGYRVGNLKLVVVHTADAEAIDDGKGPAALDEVGGWLESNGSIRHMRFSTASQPRELRLRVSGRQPGKLIVAAGAASNRRTATVDLDKLQAGTHTIALDAFPPVDDLTLGFEGPAGKKVRLGELAVNGSPLPAPGGSAMRITYPLHGECVNHQVHVRGLAATQPTELRAGRGGVARPTLEPGGFSFTASERELGGGNGEPFSFRVAATIAGRQVETTVPIDGCVDRPAAVAGADGAPTQPREDVGAPYGVVVKAKRAAKLAFAGFELEVPAGAVEQDVRLTVRPLSPDQVPVVDATMDNITVGGRAFRLGPRGMVFKKPVRLTIPVDAGRLAPDEAPHAFYFDETDKQWHEIETVVPGRNVVVARSTHFTDFIASTLKLPEHPGLQSLDPTSLKNIKVADPAAGVTQIAPPTPNAQGTANLDYPIEVPPGRMGMEPRLAITYDSSRGNGWLGVGWDLTTSSIEVDTRFGVARYDGTESYMLDGEALIPLSAPPAGAPTGGTYFARRREGRFDWIQRVNTSGGGFHWIVTDKAGVKYTYGSTTSGRVAAYNFATNVTDVVRTFKWLIERAEDIHGNRVNYSYSGLTGNNGDSWTQKYPLSITYTAHSSGTPAAQYSVAFTLKSGARADTFSNGRPGFQVLTQKLLDRVDVKNGTTIVRRYQLTYMTGDFGKSLLQKIAVFGKGATATTVSTNPIAEHTLDYYRTPTDGNNRLEIFGRPDELGESFPYAIIQTPEGVPASGQTLRDQDGNHSSNGVSIGIAGGGNNSSSSHYVTQFEDMNGDGLPDYLPFMGTSTGLTQSIYDFNGTPLGIMSPATFPGLDPSYGADMNHFLTASYHIGPFSGSEDHGNLSETTAMHIDVNGDGLLDQVTGAKDQALHARLNLGGLQGFSPEIVLPGYIKTGLGFDCNDIFESGTLAAPIQQNPFPTADVITKWVAPYAGEIIITGRLTRVEQGGDGMVATLLLGNTKLWERTVGPDDLLPTSNPSSCTPANGTPYGTACGPDTGVGIKRTVAKGDRIYTRVHGINNTDHDGLKWDTTIEYTSSPQEESTAPKEAWGPFRYKWTEARDQRVVGRFYRPWKAPFKGNVDVALFIAKDPTADDVLVTVDKYRPSTDTSSNLALYSYGSAQTADPNAAPIEFPVPGLEIGDEIHVTIKSETPIDPGTIKVLAAVSYNYLFRENGVNGGTYSGQPRCTSAPGGGASMCTIENPLGTGPSNDPMAATPLAGAVLNQIIPAYYPLQRWIYQQTATPNPPATSLDGRIKVMTTSGTIPKICYTNTVGNINQYATLVIQTVNKLLFKKQIRLDYTGDVATCYAAPSQPSGQQIFFSVYTTSPVDPAFFRAKLGNADQLGGVDIYTPDPDLMELDRFPYIGGVESMASGYHNFYMGLWNGNADFDESYINGVGGNNNYQPLWQSPLPKEALAQGTLAFSLNPLDWLEAAYHYVAAFGEYLWDKASSLVHYVGSTIVDGIRWIGSIAGKIMAWAFCTVAGNEYEAEGIQVTESHNTQEGVGAIVNVARSSGFAVTGLDLVDMNGDRYPDQISTKGVRYAHFDPQTNSGRFCPTPQTTASCAMEPAPTVTWPGNKIREITHAMHSWSVTGAVTFGDVPQVNAVGQAAGVDFLGGSIKYNASQGYLHTKRDLIDINGDGLPDIVDVNTGQCTSANNNGFGLCVQLNYGYGFSTPITWDSPNWSTGSPAVPNLEGVASSFVAQWFADAMVSVGQSIQGEDPPSSKTIRLQEEGHKGGGIMLSAYSYGMDETYTRTLVDLVDVNGDGLPDQLMKLPNQDYRVKINTGAGFATETTVPAYPWQYAAVLYPLPQFFVPVSEADALGFSRGNSSDSGYDIGVYNDSSGPHNRKSIIELMDINGDGRVDQVLKNGNPYNMFDVPENQNVWARLNQTGRSNLLRIVNRPLGGNVQVDYRRDINRVGNETLPWGESIKVDLPEARQTMSIVIVNDNRGGAYEDAISYGFPYNDRAEREFFGYASVKVAHVGSSGPFFAPETQMYFHNQDYYRRGLLYAQYESEPDGRVLHGTVTEHRYGATGSTTKSQYKTFEQTLEQPFNGKIFRNDISYPLSAFSGQSVVSAAPAAHHVTRTWDATGNLTDVRDFGDLATGADNVWQEIRYATFTGQHFTAVDRIISHLAGPGTVFAQRDATFTVTNNRPQVTQIRDFIYGGNQPGTGTAYTGQATQTSVYSFTYDPVDLGNLKTFTDPTTYRLTFGYDATKTHVTSVSDSFSLTSSRTMNMDFGLPLTTTDANAKVVTYSYDVYGRLSKVWAPTDPTSGQATIQMSYSKGGTTAATFPWALTQHKDFQSTTGDTIDTVTFVDGVGRVIQTKKEAELLQANGTTVRGFDISGLTVFDERGRVMAQSQPFFDSASPTTTLVPAAEKSPTFYTYDTLGRVGSTSVGGFVTTKFYAWADASGPQPDDALPAGFTGTRVLVTTRDANGNETREYRNGAGQIVANKRFVTIASTRQSVVTKYAYDILGNISTVTDAKNNVTSATYDSLSRMVSLTSPDAGRTDWRYALTGLLGEKQTPNIRGANQFIKYTYDRNRPTGIDYPTMTDVSYVYGLSTEGGDANFNRAGRIKTVNMEGGNETRRYDAFGNVSQTTTTLTHINNTTLPSPVVTMKYSYDWLGRMRTMTFPQVFTDTTWNIPAGDGEVITYTYDKGGMIDKITGKPTPTSATENYLNDVGYDEFGSRANLVSGNGIDTKYTYTPDRHLLDTVTATGKATSGTVQFANYKYGYDPVGNILTITNSPPQSALQAVGTKVGVGPISITNTYDEIDRLRTSTGIYRGHTTFGHTYSSTFAYDTIDNITSKNQSDTGVNFPASAVGLQGGTPGNPVVPTTYSLTYNYTPGKPHQPATITDTNAGSTRTRTERFDGNGNNTGDTLSTTPPTTRTLVWDEADRLKSVTQGTSTQGLFRYDPDGERTQKRDTSNTTTFYFNQFLVIDGTRRMTKHLFAGETRIASKTEAQQITTPVKNFYHPDHIGSTSYVSDATQLLVQHERYFPFGERWAEASLDEVSTANGNIPRDYLFTGQELDRSTGFYYLGARYLDPRTSNWLSTDPILAEYLRGEPNSGVLAPRNLGLYSYGWNNPVMLVDPEGLAPVCSASQCPSIEAEEKARIKFEQEVRRALGLPETFLGPSTNNPKWGTPEAFDDPEAKAISERRMNELAEGASAGIGMGGVTAPSTPAPAATTPAEPTTPEGWREKYVKEGVPESQLGPSGKPKRHFVDMPSRKAAEDAARRAGSGEAPPMEHGNDTLGSKPHFHPTTGTGKKIPGPHYNYPYRTAYPPRIRR
jgi:RHS repeat-associated protein